MAKPLKSMKKSLVFSEKYFSTGLYSGVNFEQKFTMFWWSCRFYSNLIKKYRRKGKLLDVGCGLGHVLRNLEKDFQTTGVDINKWAIIKAKTVSPKSKFVFMRAEEISKINERFDVIVMRHLVEHLDKPEQVLSSIQKALNDNGLLLLATPNPCNFMARLKGKEWVGFKDKTHVSIKKPREWLSILKKNGFSIVLKTSDGFWAVPYVPLIPVIFQKFVFGFLGGIQAVTGIIFLPINWGEDLIILASKKTKFSNAKSDKS